jgi:hypothetical protein
LNDRSPADLVGQRTGHAASAVMEVAIEGDEYARPVAVQEQEQGLFQRDWSRPLRLD